MSHVQSSGAKPPNTETTETLGKQLFRHAWDYVQRIDQVTKSCRHTLDLFKPELQNLRRKLREKCEQILLLSCSYRRKTEELLWKKAFYEVVQRCKIHKQELDVGSPLSLAYHDHLSTGSNYYVGLLQKLEVQYGITVAELDGSQLEDLELDSTDMQWLKASCYRCLIYLGDLARYKVDVGGSPYEAVAYYHHAISLDPAKGTAFNQLAALAGDKNEYLDAVYYYLRSMTTPHPFEGSVANLQRILDKNKDQLEALQSKAEYTKEPNIRDFTQRILLVQFLHLQHMLQPGTRHYKKEPQDLSCAIPKRMLEVVKACEGDYESASEDDLAKLCEGVINRLDECLNYDLQVFEDTCSERALTAVKGGEDQERVVVPLDSLACLPSDLLLKISALSILPSHSLRLQGSTYTPAATAFALAVFSQLLDHSLRRLAHLLLHTLQIKTQDSDTSSSVLPIGSEKGTNTQTKLPEFDQLIENDESMLEILMRQLGIEPLAKELDGTVNHSELKKDSGQHLHTEEVRTKVKEPAGGPQVEQNISKRKQRLRKIMHSRRRKRSGCNASSSSEEEETDSSGSDSEKGSASDGSTLSKSSSEGGLSVFSESLGEDDLEMLESLSESGSSSEEENSAALTTLASSSHPQRNTSLSFMPKRSSDGTKPPSQLPQTSEHQMGPPKKDRLAAKSSLPSIKEGTPRSPGNSTSKLLAHIPQQQKANTAELHSKDDVLLQQVLDETRLQSAVHLVCSVAAEESYLMILKVFADWLQSYPVVIATCFQSSSVIWSRLAALLNFLPTEDQLKSTGLGEGSSDSGIHRRGQCTALVEDMALRGFSPLVRAQETLQFNSANTTSKQKQASIRICCLHRFGQYVANATTVPSFTWDSSTRRFIGPAQKTKAETEAKVAAHRKDDQEAQLNRSKLMKAMAHQRLQSEVATLAEASAKKQAAIFTPYLLPDAPSLCTGLHIIKKLLKTEKFVIIITKSVIEMLDGMKKGKENYAAREAIKFLERELQSGNKFIRAQKFHETLQPGKRKPAKMDTQAWHFNCFTDCAIYFNQTYADKGSSRGVATLLLDSQLMNLLDDPEQQAEQPQLAKAIQQAQDGGVEISTMLGFYTTWKSQNSRVAKS